MSTGTLADQLAALTGRVVPVATPEVISEPDAGNTSAPVRTSESFDAGDLALAVALVKALGEKEALAVVDGELGAPYGRARRQNGVREPALNAIARLPERAAAPLREVFASATALTTGNAGTCNTRLSETQEAIASGAASAMVRAEGEAVKAVSTGALVAPAVPESSDPEADLAAFEGWKTQYTNWWMGLSEIQRRVLPRKHQNNPQYNGELFQKVSGHLNARVLAVRVEKFAAVIAVCATYEEALAAVEPEMYTSGVREAMSSSKWAWEWFGVGNYSKQNPTRPLEDGEPERMSLNAVVKLAAEQMLPLNALSAIRAEALRRCPCNAGEVCVTDSGMWLVHSDGRTESHYSEMAPAEKRGMSLPTIPGNGGWFHLPEKKWLGPEVAKAYFLVKSHRSGAVLITDEVISSYGRHPEKNYPRFYFQVGAGSGRASFDIPVWRPMQGEGHLVEFLDAIALLRQHRVNIPATAYWLDIKLGQTKAGNPRLDPVHTGESAMSAAFYTSRTGAMSHGRHGWDGGAVGADETRAVGNARVLWDKYVSSRGGGLNAERMVVWLPKGSVLPLSNGKGLTFDGEKVAEVAGAGLATEDDPSRE